MASNLYLLQCPQCQHPVEVQSRHAGQTVQCSECEHSFDAPRLGELKNLPQVASAETGPATSAPSSILKRWLFTLGLAMTVLLGASGYGVYQFASSIQQELNPEQALQEIGTKIDKFSDDQVYQLAESYDSEDTIGEYFQPDLVKSNKQGEILTYVAYGLLGLAAIGLLMLIGSFLVK